MRSLVFISLFCGIFLTQAHAASAPSWSQQPSWESDAPPVSQPRRSSRNGDLSAPASPFAPGSHNLALDIGQVFLMGDLGSNYSDSIGFQAHYSYGVSDLFAFDASLGYSDHTDGRFSMTSLLAGLRTNLSWYDRVIPYFVFGLGFYRPSYQVASSGSLLATATNTSSVSPVLFGVHLGPGVDLEITKQVFFGAALTFHDAFGSSRVNATTAQTVGGGTYTSFLLHAGVAF